MDCSLNIVNLIESSPITRLSGSYNNRFISNIKDTFTDIQQQLFVSSFYCYLNYHPTNDFVIDLDNVWQWLGFSQKAIAKRTLEKYFTVENDYKVLLYRSVEQTNEGRGGHNREQIMLNIKTFKMFCIKSSTKKADEIHEYFVKLEELLQQLVQDESDELKQQLQKVENEKDELQNKLIEATEDIKLLQVKEDYPYMYIFNINERDIYPPKLKIGFTKNVNNRIKPFKQLHHNGKIELVVEVLNQNIRTVEHFIHSLLANFNISGEIFQLDVEEAKLIILRVANMLKINSITNSNERYSKNLKLYENELVIVDSQLPEKISTRDFACQTDPIENTFPSIDQPKDEFTEKFDTYIQEHCIVRDDVEVSTVDIMGQYRIVTQSASKEMYNRLKDYLDKRFKPCRLKTQNKSQVVNGYQGVTLKELKYNKSLTTSNIQNFIFHACIFSPSGKVLFEDLLNEYKKWKEQIKLSPTGEEKEELKKYLKDTNYVLYTTIWANNGGGQGYYGLSLKSEMDRHRTTSSTGKKVEKRMVETNELLGTWETIAKAAEAEKICAAKMSRSIKNRVTFNDDYYFVLRPIASSSNLSP
jgi:phage anti-repressor protein